MTLITTIINENIRCIAADRRFTDGIFFPPKNQKIFEIKNGIISFYNAISLSVVELLHDPNHINIPIGEFIRTAFKELKYKNNNNDFMGIYYLNQNRAKLYYIPFKVEFDLCSNDNNIKNWDKIDMNILELLNNNIFFNPSITDGKIDLDYYHRLRDCFLSIYPKEISNITEKNIVKIVSAFYERVFNDENLHKNIIGDNLDIFYYNHIGKLIQICDVFN